MRCCLVLWLLWGLSFGTARADDVWLEVRGEVRTPLRLTAEDLAKMPRTKVRATEHDGREAGFEGVALGELLRRAGVESGEALRGPLLAECLLVEAADGYRVVFALPELDPAFTDRVVLLADRRNGEPLDAKTGPLRIVVPGEKRQARWVRQVVALTVLHPASFP